MRLVALLFCSAMVCLGNSFNYTETAKQTPRIVKYNQDGEVWSETYIKTKSAYKAVIKLDNVVITSVSTIDVLINDNWLTLNMSEAVVTGNGDKGLAIWRLKSAYEKFAPKSDDSVYGKVTYCIVKLSWVNKSAIITIKGSGLSIDDYGYGYSNSDDEELFILRVDDANFSIGDVDNYSDYYVAVDIDDTLSVEGECTINGVDNEKLFIDGNEDEWFLCNYKVTASGLIN